MKLLPFLFVFFLASCDNSPKIAPSAKETTETAKEAVNTLNEVQLQKQNQINKETE